MFQLDPSNRLATIHQRNRQTEQRPDSIARTVFGRPFVKRFALWYQTVVYMPVCLSVCLSVLSVLSVCDVGVLWPNGWADQDETWHAGRPRPWPHCVRWEPSSPPPKGHSHSPQFSTHVYCGQTAARIKMPFGTEVGLGPDDTVLDGDPAPFPKKGTEPPNFRPILLWPNLLWR